MAGLRISKTLLALLTLEIGFPAHGVAQAWLPPEGQAFFSIGYGNVFVRDHTWAQGDTYDDGHIRSNTIGLSLEYALSSRLAFDLAIPLVIAKYYATESALYGYDGHVALDGTTIDNGNYHGEFQDFQFGLRWQAVKAPVVITPYVGAVIPSHGYRYFAHSAVGKDLHQYIAGFYAGRRLDPLLDDAYVQLRYSYAFVEKVIGISHDRSSADLQLGYFLTTSLGAQALLSYGYTHGGISAKNNDEFLRLYCDPVLQCGPTDPTPTWQHHDQIGHEVYLDAAAGVTYALTESTVVFANYFSDLVNYNGHKIRRGLSFGATWAFSPVQIYRRLTGKADQD